LDEELLKTADAVVVTTAHTKGVDYNLVLEASPLILDTKNVISKVTGVDIKKLSEASSALNFLPKEIPKLQDSIKVAVSVQETGAKNLVKNFYELGVLSAVVDEDEGRLNKAGKTAKECICLPV